MDQLKADVGCARKHLRVLARPLRAAKPAALRSRHCICHCNAKPVRCRGHEEKRCTCFWTHVIIHALLPTDESMRGMKWAGSGSVNLSILYKRVSTVCGNATRDFAYPNFVAAQPAALPIQTLSQAESQLDLTSRRSGHCKLCCFFFAALWPSLAFHPLFRVTRTPRCHVELTWHSSALQGRNRSSGMYAHALTFYRGKQISGGKD